MASLEAARAHAQQEGVWEEPLRAGSAINAALQQLPGLKVLSQEHVGALHATQPPSPSPPPPTQLLYSYCVAAKSAAALCCCCCYCEAGP